MKQGEYEIHANPGKVFDCACKVGVECDGETIAMRFPQIDRDDDNIGPMVYAHMRGTELRVTLADRENADIEFAWDEGAGVWRACGTANVMESFLPELNEEHQEQIKETVAWVAYPEAGYMRLWGMNELNNSDISFMGDPGVVCPTAEEAALEVGRGPLGALPKCPHCGKPVGIVAVRTCAAGTMAEGLLFLTRFTRFEAWCIGEEQEATPTCLGKNILYGSVEKARQAWVQLVHEDALDYVKHHQCSKDELADTRRRLQKVGLTVTETVNPPLDDTREQRDHEASLADAIKQLDAFAEESMPTPGPVLPPIGECSKLNGKVYYREDGTWAVRILQEGRDLCIYYYRALQERAVVVARVSAVSGKVEYNSTFVPQGGKGDAGLVSRAMTDAREDLEKGLAETPTVPEAVQPRLPECSKLHGRKYYRPAGEWSIRIIQDGLQLKIYHDNKDKDTNPLAEFGFVDGQVESVTDDDALGHLTPGDMRLYSLAAQDVREVMESTLASFPARDPEPWVSELDRKKYSRESGKWMVEIRQDGQSLNIHFDRADTPIIKLTAIHGGVVIERTPYTVKLKEDHKLIDLAETDAYKELHKARDEGRINL